MIISTSTVCIWRHRIEKYGLTDCFYEPISVLSERQFKHVVTQGGTEANIPRIHPETHLATKQGVLVFARLGIMPSWKKQPSNDRHQPKQRPNQTTMFPAK